MTGVVVNDICFSYPQRPVLHHISCRFDQGLFHVILGPNGSGKTTFLDILSGFSKPDSGEVRLGKSSLPAMGRRDIARQISLVSQDYTIRFPFTVEEVVLMGRHPFIDRFSRPMEKDLSLAKEAMALTGISHLKACRITELSGGEKQRTVFARALCQDTPLLLLDEAFANMDIRHTLHLLKLLKHLVQDAKKTVIAVLHDLNMAAQWADTLTMLKEGRLLFQDCTDMVFTDQNLKTVFDVDAQIAVNPITKSKQAYFQM